MTEFQNITPIYNAFGEEYLKSLPILDIGKRIGYTDYIDFIKIDDMKYSIMKGVDVYRRLFLAIKVKITGTDLKYHYEVGTFFQRFTDNKSEWAYGTCYNLNTLYNDSRIRIHDYELLENRLHQLFNHIEIINDNHTIMTLA